MPNTRMNHSQFTFVSKKSMKISEKFKFLSNLEEIHVNLANTMNIIKVLSEYDGLLVNINPC